MKKKYKITIIVLFITVFMYLILKFMHSVFEPNFLNEILEWLKSSTNIMSKGELIIIIALSNLISNIAR